MKLITISMAAIAAFSAYTFHTADKKDIFNAVAEQSAEVKIIRQWNLPPVLTEISALSLMDDNRFACVQDELGTLYIFNKATDKIEREIPFAGTGDYEGVAVTPAAIYVVRSDGRLYELSGLTAAKPTIKEYSTSLTGKQNVEGLCYDKKHNRLLLAIKGKEPGSDAYKGIYAFTLADKKFMDAPVYKIDLTNEIFATGKKKSTAVQPSAIAIHPASSEIYITDGPSSRLLVLTPNGSIKSLVTLGKPAFAQPEGITFNDKGDMFISNEGRKKGAGNIIEVKIE